MSANNESRQTFKEIARVKGWERDGNRNVAVIKGRKYSFSVSSNIPECRQVYEDTQGFITLLDDKLYYYPVSDFGKFTVSRVSPKGLKAYSIRLDSTEDMFEIQ